MATNHEARVHFSSDIHVSTLTTPVRQIEQPPIASVATLLTSAKCGDANGRSYVFGFSTESMTALQLIVSALAEEFAGFAGDPAAGWERAYRRATGEYGEGRLTSQALAALDIALWDVHCKLLGEPLWKTLGGTRRPVETYAGTAFTEGADIGVEMQRWYDRGYRTLKLHLGRADQDSDRKFVNELRRRFPDIRLLVDLNRAWSLEQTLDALPWLEAAGVGWLEDPTPYDADAYRKIHAKASIPLVLGEYTHYSDWAAYLMAADTCDYFMLDLQYQAGITGWLRMARLAEERSVRVVPHIFPEVSGQLASACQGCGPISYSPWWDDLQERRFEVVDGTHTPTSDPGVGMSLLDPSTLSVE
jgi:L-alanine-DL-glutamate epimerase-like enolase superfamily enzyme